MFKSITLIGLGLIGGSFAKAVHERLPEIILSAVDSNADYIRSAIDEGTISDGDTTVTERLCRSELIMICTPISTIPEIIGKVCAYADPNTVIADAASVNKYICDYADTIGDIRYVSTHPMAGSEKKGYHTSFSFLFENACTILSPCSKSDGEAIDGLKQLYSALGALPLVVAPEEHDRAAALISHLPHIVASALVNLLKEKDSDGLAHRFAAGGFKDITRIASSSPEMWADISEKNRDALLSSLNAFSNLLELYKTALISGDSKALSELLISSKEERDSLTGNIGGIIPSEHRISVDVEDKVGVTSRISGILTDAGISIKNIAVRNSREYEGGIMTITVASAKEAAQACRLLNSHNITSRTEK